MNISLEDLSTDELLQLRKNIDTKLALTKTKYYVIYNNCYGGFNISKTIFEFYQFLYPDKNQTHWKISQSCRWDPTFVLSIAALGCNENDDGEMSYSDLRITPYDVAPNEHIEIHEYDGNEWVEIREGILYQKIPERPKDLRKKLDEFAKNKNLKLDEAQLIKLPVEGPYSTIDH